jgi:hypothetical protein
MRSGVASELASEAELASAAASGTVASPGLGWGGIWGPTWGGWAWGGRACWGGWAWGGWAWGGKFVPESLPQATPRATWATVQVASAVRRSASFSPEGKGEGFFIE